MATSNWKRAATGGDDALHFIPAGERDGLQNTETKTTVQAQSRIAAYTIDATLNIVEVAYA